MSDFHDINKYDSRKAFKHLHLDLECENHEGYTRM